MKAPAATSTNKQKSNRPEKASITGAKSTKGGRGSTATKSKTTGSRITASGNAMNSERRGAKRLILSEDEESDADEQLNDTSNQDPKGNEIGKSFSIS